MDVPSPSRSTAGFNSTISAFASGDGSMTLGERSLELFTGMAVAEVQQDVALVAMGEILGYAMMCMVIIGLVI